MNLFDKYRCQKLIDTELKPALVASANGTLIPFPILTENGPEILFVLKGDHEVVRDFINEDENASMTAAFYHYYETRAGGHGEKNYIFRIEFEPLKDNHLVVESVFNKTLQENCLPFLMRQEGLYLMVVFSAANGKHRFVTMKRFGFDYTLVGGVV